MTSSFGSPCAACKFLRRKCTPDCVFAPYFPPDQPQKFATVHKIFGASNVTKLLNELPPHRRDDAVNSLAYEADARIKDPVYGCVGAISMLQRRIIQLQKELAMARSELSRYIEAGIFTGGTPYPTLPAQLQGSVASTYPGIGMAPTTREHHLVAREQLLDVIRDQPITRDQFLDYARASHAAATYDTNPFAPIGLSGAFHGQMSAYSHSRLGPGGSERATGRDMNQLSPR